MYRLPNDWTLRNFGAIFGCSSRATWRRRWPRRWTRHRCRHEFSRVTVSYEYDFVEYQLYKCNPKSHQLSTRLRANYIQLQSCCATAAPERALLKRLNCSLPHRFSVTLSVHAAWIACALALSRLAILLVAYLSIFIKIIDCKIYYYEERKGDRRCDTCTIRPNV